MDDFGAIGLSWRQGGAETLARFTLDRDLRAERLAELRAAMGVRELVHVATCNRVELYFRLGSVGMEALRARAFRGLVGREPAPGEAERMLRAWAGEGAAEHLFLVAAGLDSAEVGETEIVGQLRRALDEAIDLDLVANRGGRLVGLFEAALKVARRVRREAGLEAGHTSLAEIGLAALDEHVGLATDPHVLLVGCSPMTERCALGLRGRGWRVTWANRSLERARAGAREDEAVLALDRLGEARLPAFDGIVAATAATAHVLDAPLVAKLAATHTPLFIDFATPPDIDGAAARAHGASYLDMDAILARASATRARRLADAAGAREAIDAALERLRVELGDVQVAPLVAALQSHYRGVAREQAARFAEGLSSEPGDPAERVIAFAEALAKQLAHLPSTGLRGIARACGRDAVDAFVARADADLAAAFDLAQRLSEDEPEHPTRSQA